MAKIETDSGGVVEVCLENDGDRAGVSLAAGGGEVAMTWAEASVLIGMLKYCVGMIAPTDGAEE